MLLHQKSVLLDEVSAGQQKILKQRSAWGRINACVSACAKAAHDPRTNQLLSSRVLGFKANQSWIFSVDFISGGKMESAGSAIGATLRTVMMNCDSYRLEKKERAAFVVPLLVIMLTILLLIAPALEFRLTILLQQLQLVSHWILIPPWHCYLFCKLVQGGRGGGAGAVSKPATAGNGKEHSAWVASGCPIRGPQGWTQYKTDQGEKYYHNSNTNVTQWEPPAGWTGPAWCLPFFWLVVCYIEYEISIRLGWISLILFCF